MGLTDSEIHEYVTLRHIRINGGTLSEEQLKRFEELCDKRYNKNGRLIRDLTPANEMNSELELQSEEDHQDTMHTPPGDVEFEPVVKTEEDYTIPKTGTDAGNNTGVEEAAADTFERRRIRWRDTKELAKPLDFHESGEKLRRPLGKPIPGDPNSAKMILMDDSMDNAHDVGGITPLDFHASSERLGRQLGKAIPANPNSAKMILMDDSMADPDFKILQDVDEIPRAANFSELVGNQLETIQGGYTHEAIAGRLGLTKEQFEKITTLFINGTFYGTKIDRAIVDRLMSGESCDDIIAAALGEDEEQLKKALSEGISR